MNEYEEVKKSFFEKLEADSLLNNENTVQEIKKAVVFGESKHTGQKRKSTPLPYFIHCLRVATNLLNEEDRDKDLIIAALLHDTVEDTKTTFDEITEIFGSKVTNLVKGMTKVPSHYEEKWGSEKYYKEGFFGPLEKAAEIDSRVWKIKLSDRSDNLQDYYKFSSDAKIAKYMWESEKLLDFVSKYSLKSPLSQKINEQLKFYKEKFPSL